MAKNFGKFLFFTAAIGAVAAGAYYYLHNNNDTCKEDEDFDDFDDFSDDLDDETDCSTGERSYVSLNLDEAKVKSEQTASTDEPKTEKVEEFFDDDEPLEDTDSLDDDSMDAM